MRCPLNGMRLFWGIVLSVLLLAPAGCRGGGGSSGGPGNLNLLATNVTPGQVWPINLPIVFQFDRPVDPNSVSLQTITFVPVPSAALGAQTTIPPVQGSFSLDPKSGGTAVLFQPLCPTDPQNQNGGLIPGYLTAQVEYFCSVPGTSDSAAPVVSALDGSRLADSTAFNFFTPSPPASPFFDPVPGPPKVANLADLPPTLALNLAINPIPPLTIEIDQPVLASSVSSGSVKMLFDDPQTGSTLGVPLTVSLTANCSSSGGSTLLVVPKGVLPPGQTLRLALSSGLSGFGLSDWNPTDLAFHQASVQPVASPPPQRDAFLEDFADSSGFDANPDVPYALASWGGGTLSPAPLFTGTFSTTDIEIGYGTQNGQTVLFSTDGAFIKDVTGTKIFVPSGVILCRDFTMKTPPAGFRSELIATGSNPLIIRASGRVTIESGAWLRLTGFDGGNQGGLNTPQIPIQGGSGGPTGGKGGNGSPLTNASDPKGEDGEGPFGIPGIGGRGGHSGFGPTPGAGGGGGGSWGRKERDSSGNFVEFCYGGCTICSQCPKNGCSGNKTPANTNGEPGNGHSTGIDAVFGTPPALGGAAGPAQFLDGIDSNNFLGRKPIGSAVVPGELPGLQGGEGGGGGGDMIFAPTFPPPSSYTWQSKDREGAGGGGGGGALQIDALLSIKVEGWIDASGGSGGSASSGGGGGGGGMILLQSPGQIHLGKAASITSIPGQRGPGITGCKNDSEQSRGGAGGKGIIQLGLPFDPSTSVACGGVLQPGVQPGALLVEPAAGGVKAVACEIDPDLVVLCDPDPEITIVDFGPLSVARSGWYYTGFADRSSPPLFEFEGTDPADGKANPAAFLVLASGCGALSQTANSLTVDSPPLAAYARSEPRILLEDELVLGAASFRLTGASISGDSVTLGADPLSGPLPPAGCWEIRRRCYGASSNGTLHAIPSTAEIRILFEGADETSPGSALPLLPPAVPATADASLLAGRKLVRFTVLFNLNAKNLPLTGGLLPAQIQFMKIPLGF